MPQTVIFGCAGHALSDEERAFFREVDPWGFILFARNIDNPEQVYELTSDFRDVVGRQSAPVLIDQEGGRVARLRPPHWRKLPPPAIFGELYAADPEAGLQAAFLNFRLLGEELQRIGINVDCVPMLDVRTPESNQAVIGDRAFSDDPQAVAKLGRTAADALMSQGVLPVIKHMPGHGRAVVDSHDTVPIVEASIEELERVDFVPFRELNDLPLGMTGHLIYPAIADGETSTLSRTIIQEVIRSHNPGRIGFDGLLMTDDLSMGALQVGYEERARQALEAGCDVILHCNGERSEMEAVAKALKPLQGKSLERAEKAMDFLGIREEFDSEIARNRLQDLITRV